jgi:hypothetical protein
LTAGDRIKREGKRDCGNDGGMKVCDDYNNYEEEEKEEEDAVASTSLATTLETHHTFPLPHCSPTRRRCLLSCRIIATINGFRSTLASCEAVQALAWAGYDSQWLQAAFNVDGYEVEVPITLPYSRKVKTHPYSGTPRSRCICYW